MIRHFSHEMGWQKCVYQSSKNEYTRQGLINSLQIEDFFDFAKNNFVCANIVRDLLYFESIFGNLVDKLSIKLGQSNEQALLRFDSTVITLSGLLLKDGLSLGGKAIDRHYQGQHWA